MQLTVSHFSDWLVSLSKIYAEQKEYLTELDAAIGDADHGINMARGFGKVAEKVTAFEGEDVGGILKDTGMTLLASVGGASGPLYGTFFTKAGVAASGKSEIDAEAMLAMLEAGKKGVIQRGRAALEDKTMVDALEPAVKAYTDTLAGGGSLAECLTACADAAKAGMQSTVPLQAKKGRASYLGERSIGHQDPGATSVHFLLQSLADICR